MEKILDKIKYEEMKVQGENKTIKSSVHKSQAYEWVSIKAIEKNYSTT